MVCNQSSPLSLLWSSDLTPTAKIDVADQVHIWTKAFANRHVAVSLPDRNIMHAHDADVLGGRGKHVERHPGNVRLTELVNVLKISYHLGTPGTKCEIVDRILNIMVKKENRRFLKLVPYQRDANIWYWVLDSKRRAKVSQKLRDAYQIWSKKHYGSSQAAIGTPTAHAIRWLPVDTATDQIKPVQLDTPETPYLFGNATLPKTHMACLVHHHYGNGVLKSIASPPLVPQPAPPELHYNRVLQAKQLSSTKMRSSHGSDLQSEVHEASSPNTPRQDDDMLSLSKGIPKSGSTLSQPNTFSFSHHTSRNAGTAVPPTPQPQVRQEECGGSSVTEPQSISGFDLEAVGAPETELDASSTTIRGNDYHSQDFPLLVPQQRNENAPGTSTESSSILTHSIDHYPQSKVPSSKHTNTRLDPNQTIDFSTFFDESRWFLPVHDDQQHAPASITPAVSLRFNEV